MFAIWPPQLSAAPGLKWRRREVVGLAGTAVDGSQPRGTTDGGGRWELTMSGVWLRNAGVVKLARALEVMMDGGAAPIIVNTCERAYAPMPPEAEGDGRVPNSDGTAMSDGSLYQSRFISAEVYINAALRATQMTVLIRAGAPLTGGEAFSIYHAPPRGYDDEDGKRRYQIGRAGLPVNVAGGFTQLITFRTPLRAAVTVGTKLDFDSVGSVVRLLNPDDFFEDISMARFSNLNPVWQEAF